MTEPILTLPEADREYLSGKGYNHHFLAAEVQPDGSQQKAIVFPDFPFASSLQTMKDGLLVPCNVTDVMIVIPKGYATTKLDSFYTSARLTRGDGSDPHAASGSVDMFGRSWQFWSRHLDDGDWVEGRDGMDSYLNYVLNELRIA